MSETPTQTLLQRAVRHLAPVMPLLTEVGERFAAAGYELALVGGRCAMPSWAAPHRTWT